MNSLASAGRKGRRKFLEDVFLAGGIKKRLGMGGSSELGENRTRGENNRGRKSLRREDHTRRRLII